MNLKEKLQQIAKNKILKSQNVKTVVKSPKKPRVTNKVKIIESIAGDSTATYFPEIPKNHIEYSRPAESRSPTEKVRELTKKFQENLKSQKRAPTKKIRYITTEMLNEAKK